jgi:hypothetical protein
MIVLHFAADLMVAMRGPVPCWTGLGNLVRSILRPNFIRVFQTALQPFRHCFPLLNPEVGWPDHEGTR